MNDFITYWEVWSRNAISSSHRGGSFIKRKFTSSQFKLTSNKKRLRNSVIHINHCCDFTEKLSSRRKLAMICASILKYR